jgi:hypothetical protein
MKAPEAIRDVAVLAGGACLVYGAWLAWHPAELILAGLTLAGFGIAWELDVAQQKAKAERDRRAGL